MFYFSNNYRILLNDHMLERIPQVISLINELHILKLITKANNIFSSFKFLCKLICSDYGHIYWK